MSKYHSNVGKEKILSQLKKRNLKIHFVGVGGVGMYSLFVLSSKLGYRVSGSDREASPLFCKLSNEGYDVWLGHIPDKVGECGLLVYTLAVSCDNPEILRAEENNIMTVSRAEYLGALMENYSERISVSGSHGKSTTTAMISAIFESAMSEPTTVIGASLPGKSTPLLIGKNRLLIFEGCEYKDSFLRFSPTVTVFTNLELDHVDYFLSLDDLKKSFIKAMDIPALSVVNLDDENLREIIPHTSSRVVTFGESENADYRITAKMRDAGLYTLKIRHEGMDDVEIDLSLPGKFNVQNAAAAASVALELAVPTNIVKEALSEFSGIERRLEAVGFFENNPVFYDYAHHPTEILAAIQTVREVTGKRVTVIFKPHTYSRTAGLMSDFARALSFADRVLLCEISAIRESKIDGVSSDALAEMVGSQAKKIRDADVLSELSDVGDSAIIIMGAANLDTVKRLILDN